MPYAGTNDLGQPLFDSIEEQEEKREELNKVYNQRLSSLKEKHNLEVLEFRNIEMAEQLYLCLFAKREQAYSYAPFNTEHIKETMDDGVKFLVETITEMETNG